MFSLPAEVLSVYLSVTMTLINANSNWRLHHALFVAFFLWPLVNNASAQLNIQASVWEAGLQIDQVDETGREQIVLGMKRVVPLDQLLPQVTSDSNIDFASISAGYRDELVGKSSFRFQATALNLVLHRAVWSGGVTLLDIDRRGTVEHRATWGQIATGPGFHWHKNDSNARASSRIMAVLGASSIEFGKPVDSQGRESAFHYGWLAMGSINVLENLELRINGGHKAWTSSEKSEWLGALNILIGFSDQMTLDANARINGMLGDSGSSSRTRMGFSLTYRFLTTR